MESWRAASGWPPLHGVVSSGALPVVHLGSLWKCGSDRHKAALGLDDDCCGRSWTLPEVWGGCGSLSRLGVGGVAGVLPAVRPVVGPRLCGYVGEVLRWWRCEASGMALPNSRWCGEVRRTDENLARLPSGRRRWHPWMSSPPWRRSRGMFVMSLAHFELWLSLGESLDSVLDQHNGGVLDVVPLLGALCLETWLVPRRSPPVFATVLLDPLRCYVHPSTVCPRWRLPRIGSSPTTHLPLPLRRSEWMVRRQAKFCGSWWSSEVSGVGRDAVLCFSLG